MGWSGPIRNDGPEDDAYGGVFVDKAIHGIPHKFEVT
jgi:hypothetical protein